MSVERELLQPHFLESALSLRHAVALDKLVLGPAGEIRRRDCVQRWSCAHNGCWSVRPWHGMTGDQYVVPVHTARARSLVTPAMHSRRSVRQILRRPPAVAAAPSVRMSSRVPAGGSAKVRSRRCRGRGVRPASNRPNLVKTISEETRNGPGEVCWIICRVLHLCRKKNRLKPDLPGRTLMTLVFVNCFD